MTNLTYNLNAVLLAAVNTARSYEETRYYLGGVYVFPLPSGEGVGMVATDGHRMICATDLTGFISEPAILSLDKKLATACKDVKGKIPSLVYDGSEADSTHQARLELQSEDGAQLVAGGIVNVIYGTFPDFRRIIPDTFDAQPVLLSGKYLADFSAASYKACVATGFPIDNRNAGKIEIIGGHSANDAQLIGLGTPHCFGVLMPLRRNECRNTPENGGEKARDSFLALINESEKQTKAA